MTTNLSYGIPDVTLPCLGGGEINPSAFAGHELIVFFCPSNPGAAASEIESYASHSKAFVDGGAWVIGVLSGEAVAKAGDDQGDTPLKLAEDRDGAAWAAFEELLKTSERTEETEGGAFLFERGGCLAKSWPGRGHAEDVIRELHRRA